MIYVVLDTSVVISAVFWPGSTARRVLAALARRYYALALTDEVFQEYNQTVNDLQSRFPNCNSRGAIEWLRARGEWFEPALLGRQRSRDPRDDPILACAVAAGARFLVTNDRDLLSLEKPFGVQTATPAQFLRWLKDNVDFGSEV